MTRPPSHAVSDDWSTYLKLMRLHKFPAGSILVFWPCAWGVTMSASITHMKPSQVATQLMLYFIGSIIRHNAACIWNDICDREFDREVERCKTRPLAAGTVSMTGAVILLISQLALVIGLLLYAGAAATRMGLIGLVFLDMPYPLTKRWTSWPQTFLGLAMTWGLPVSWVSIVGQIDWDVIPILFLGSVSWSIYYDTIYACQDRRDDIKAGVKSTAVLFGDYVRPILSCFAMLFVASLAFAGLHNSQGPLYFIIAVFGAAVHLAWQLITIDFDVGSQCWKMFNANGDLGYIIWGGMLADYLHRSAAVMQ
ncbi:hypothetical protein IEO21_10422 [Rhodonia placenta]|uniref:4-hydroxybenzoate polyprenyltransferase, mitochondrial n=1 Tax=Rhodonia placenta TaxID=104341 RepID=A0A8H7NSV2_9APHY|nr:hypothetical protein IEO21_10422 [Postia placenta]